MHILCCMCTRGLSLEVYTGFSAFFWPNFRKPLTSFRNRFNQRAILIVVALYIPGCPQEDCRLDRPHQSRS
jgi:hypothetical protein